MNTPIFDLLCFEYPDLHWSQDVTVVQTLHGPIREVYGRLTVS